MRFERTSQLDWTAIPAARGITVLVAAIGILCTLTAFAQTSPQPESSANPKEQKTMAARAHGTLEAEIKPLATPGIPGNTCFSINKIIHRDLDATTKGEMFSAGDHKSGAARYVAIEVVTGELAGRAGSFVLQHFATMDANGLNMNVKVTPGSGTSELKGIEGTFRIIISNGKHTYDFETSFLTTLDKALAKCSRVEKRDGQHPRCLT